MLGRLPNEYRWIDGIRLRKRSNRRRSFAASCREQGSFPSDVNTILEKAIENVQSLRNVRVRGAIAVVKGVGKELETL
jgi:hypothetical protein